jgi:hypothetical protein
MYSAKKPLPIKYLPSVNALYRVSRTLDKEDEFGNDRPEGKFVPLRHSLYANRVVWMQISGRRGRRSCEFYARL